MSEKIELTHHQIKALLEMSEASGDPECYDDLVLQMGARTPTAAPACTPGIANARRKALSSSELTPKTRRAATPLRRGAAMTDKIPLDAALRSRVADLLHLLQFARIETPTAGDAEQAEKAVNDLERMLAAPAAAAEPEPVAWVSVSGRLPGEQGQDSEDVLCFLNGHCSLTDHKCRGGGGWGIRIGFYDAEKDMFRVAGQTNAYVTHWMPLPTAPGEDAPPATEQPDTVAVPRELLAEAESIIESYAEALKASHAPGGDWEGEEAAHDEYELEAGVASKLRALLAGGAE